MNQPRDCQNRSPGAPFYPDSNANRFQSPPPSFRPPFVHNYGGPGANFQTPDRPYEGPQQKRFATPRFADPYNNSFDCSPVYGRPYSPGFQPRHGFGPNPYRYGNSGGASTSTPRYRHQSSPRFRGRQHGSFNSPQFRDDENPGGSSNIAQYFHPDMLRDPWERLRPVPAPMNRSWSTT